MAKNEVKVLAIGTAACYMSYKDSLDGNPVRKVGYVSSVTTEYDTETSTKGYIYYLSDQPGSEPVVSCYHTELHEAPKIFNERNANARQDLRAYISVLGKNQTARNVREHN